jgi:RNA polymerase sigma factor (sigma-70 family)
MRVRKTKPKSGERVASLAVLAFRKYSAELNSYIERRIRHNHVAPDLTQDIFERFLQVEDVDAIRNPQAYLFGIASHVVREARFKEEKSMVSYDSDIIDAADGSLAHALPDNIAQRLAMQQEMNRALAQLPLIHRTLLLLVKRDGFSYEEAAAKTNLSVATVTSYLYEARAKIKLLLKP